MCKTGKGVKESTTNSVTTQCVLSQTVCLLFILLRYLFVLYIDYLHMTCCSVFLLMKVKTLTATVLVKSY